VIDLQKTFALPYSGCIRWLTYPGSGVSRELRCALVSRLFGTLPVFAAGAINTVLVSAVVAARVQRPAFVAWFAVELAIAFARLVVLILAHRSSRKVSFLTDIHIALSLGWAGSVGYGVFISLISNDWAVATLSCLSAAAMVGGICFRSFSAPRLVCCQIALLIVPLLLGAAMSDQQLLYVVFVQGPLYLAAMGAAAFQLNQMLIATVRAKQASEHSASHDALTGLLNRVGLNRDYEKLQSLTHLQTGVLFIDLDDFKLVNDSFGHAAGDRLLMMLAARLRTVLPVHAKAARIGGDEFVVLLASISMRELAELATYVADALSKPYELGAGSTAVITASIGAAASEARGDTLDALLERADRASYGAKFERKSRQSSELVLTAFKQLTRSFGPESRADLAKAS
jgi:diguanylate cyclase (GGDEF)-like protein